MMATGEANSGVKRKVVQQERADEENFCLMDFSTNDVKYIWKMSNWKNVTHDGGHIDSGWFSSTEGNNDIQYLLKIKLLSDGPELFVYFNTRSKSTTVNCNIHFISNNVKNSMQLSFKTNGSTAGVEAVWNLRDEEDVPVQLMGNNITYGNCRRLKVDFPKNLFVTKEDFVIQCLFKESQMRKMVKKVKLSSLCPFKKPVCMSEEQNFRDVTLKVGGESLKAHMCVLAANSEVFRAMFQYDVKDSTENEVLMSGVDAKTVKEMLDFIYTGKLASENNEFAKLLIAADKYGVVTLKHNCELLLSKCLTLDNVTCMIIMAEKYSAEFLLSNCVDFASSWYDNIASTEAWKNLEKKHPSLNALVLKKALQEKNANLVVVNDQREEEREETEEEETTEYEE